MYFSYSVSYKIPNNKVLASHSDSLMSYHIRWFDFSFICFHLITGDTDANMMAVFATAADSVYEDLTEIKLELNTFNQLETSPIGNTCSATILFPVSFNSSSAFKTTVLMRMKEAVEFFGML